MQSAFEQALEREASSAALKYGWDERTLRCPEGLPAARARHLQRQYPQEHRGHGQGEEGRANPQVTVREHVRRTRRFPALPDGGGVLFAVAGGREPPAG